MIDGWTPKSKAVPLRFGGWFAKALEHYYKYRATGDRSNLALCKVVHEALIDSWEHDLDAEGNRIPGTGHPWVSDRPPRTRENLIRTIVWYVAQFELEEISVVKLSDGKPAVEWSFQLEVDNGLIFCGHIDRLVEYSGDKYVMDQKTTETTIGPWWFDQFTPNTQISMYTFAGQIVYNMPVKGVIIDGAQVAVGFSRFSRGFAFRSKMDLEEWYEDTLRNIEDIQEQTRRGQFPARTTSCGMYGGCEFRGVCSHSPDVRKNYLAAEFDQRPVWNPMVPR